MGDDSHRYIQYSGLLRPRPLSREFHWLWQSDEAIQEFMVPQFCSDFYSHSKGYQFVE